MYVKKYKNDVIAMAEPNPDCDVYLHSENHIMEGSCEGVLGMATHAYAQCAHCS